MKNVTSLLQGKQNFFRSLLSERLKLKYTLEHIPFTSLTKKQRAYWPLQDRSLHNNTFWTGDMEHLEHFSVFLIWSI